MTTEELDLLRDGTVPIDAPVVNAWVVGVVIVDSSAPAPTLTSLSPNTAELGSAVALVTLTGTGFTRNSVIVWNGGDEPTDYVSPTQVTTYVRPSTASTPGGYPVLVRDGPRRTAPQTFTFTEPAPPEAPEEPEE